MTLARIRTGETVMVVSGEHKGKTGKVLRIFAEYDKVIVEGINVVKRHTRPTAQNRDGGIFEKEAPIHISKVMPLDPETGKPTRVRTKTEADRSKVRIAKSGKVIENPPRG